MPASAELFQLALHHHQAGQLGQAEALYRQALEAHPLNASAHHNLGVVLMLQRRLGEARICFEQALELQPQHALAHVNLGNVQKEQGQLAEAAHCYRQALAISPQLSEAHFNLGIILAEVGQLGEAIASYRQALSSNPGSVPALNNLGLALTEQGQPAEAIACFQNALRIDPNNADAHYNLGVALQDQGLPTEAIAFYRQAVRINPMHASAHNNLGVALQYPGLLTEAMACFDEALRLQPDNLGARLNRSMLWLLQGDFDKGWQEYEWRWHKQGHAGRTFVEPRWDGSVLKGKTILLHAEQGFGDTIQFIRYARLVKERVGTVWFECQPSLIRLLTGVAGVDRLLEQGQPLPAFDVQASLLSLPGIFRTRLSTIPAEVPYLHADPERVEKWRGELQRLGGFRVGITWQGSPTFRDDRLRSIPLSYFEKLARLPQVRLVSLQKGLGASQLRAWGQLPCLDLSDRLTTFGETAAVMKNLDLIISSDTSVVHLAGALGVPVWTILQYTPDWRWLLARPDSPWYPSMRLFRQSRPGDWAEVVERVASALGQARAS